MRALLVTALLAVGCAHGLTPRRALDLGCGEACAREAALQQHASSTGWSCGPCSCGCRFDDGSRATAVPRRPEGCS